MDGLRSRGYDSAEHLTIILRIRLDVKVSRLCLTHSSHLFDQRDRRGSQSLGMHSYSYVIDNVQSEALLR